MQSVRRCSYRREKQALVRLTKSGPAVSEVDERSNLGMLASPVLTQERERETSASPFIMYRSDGESFETRSSHVRTSTGDLWRCAHTRENQSRFNRLAGVLIGMSNEIAS